MLWTFTLSFVASGFSLVAGLGLSCRWVLYPNSSVSGGTKMVSVSVDSCKVTCSAFNFKGINFATNGECKCIKTGDRIPTAGVNYYSCTTTDFCNPSPCLNGGVCSQLSALPYDCSCPTDYVGTNCDRAADPCKSSPCSNGGVCSSSSPDSFSCSCPSGYIGELCDTKVDPCDSSPCVNGGRCSSSFPAYSCSCPAGYTGTKCETEVDPCVSSPCANGAECSSSFPSYSCLCPVGYTGSKCETEVDPCASSPCANGGQCDSYFPYYSCLCPADYAGTKCDAEVDPCDSSPCANGGKCSSSFPSYSCSCPAGYTGPKCETEVSRDVVPSAVNPGCIKTNYNGPVTDFISSPMGVTWDVLLPNFGFNVPQNLLLNSLFFIDSIKFSDTINLAYFRIVFTKNDESKVTTPPIYPSDRSKDIADAYGVKRVDIYLSPLDDKLNSTINNLEIRYCLLAKLPFIGCPLNLLTAVAQILPLGFIMPGSNSYKISAAFNSPFVEYDLSCAGIGTAAFTSIDLGKSMNFDTATVSIWKGNDKVTVRDKDGTTTDSFNYANGINFQKGLSGDRIRLTIDPKLPLANQAFSGSFWFSKFSVYFTVKV